MWTRIYQHHSKASLESFVIIFFSYFTHYIIIGENYLCIRRSKSAFLIIEQKICSFADVCNPRRRRPKISFIFIHSWVREKETSSYFHGCCEYFFILLMHSAMTKRPHGKGDGNNYFGYIFFSAMIIVLWTELSQGYRISWWWSSSSFSSSWRLLIFYSLCIKHAIIIHETWAKNFVSL